MNKWKARSLCILISILILGLLWPALALAQEPEPEARLVTVGRCPEDVPLPTLVGSPRNLGANEDTTTISVILDNNRHVLCWRISGTWPGNSAGGLTKFVAKVFVSQGSTPSGPLVPPSPFTYEHPISIPSPTNIPTFYGEMPLPCGVRDYYFKAEYSQTQVDGNGNWLGGTAGRDWSTSVHSSYPCKLYLPFPFNNWPPPPPPTPLTCEGWTSEVYDRDGVVESGLPFSIAPEWTESRNELLLYPGEQGHLKINYHGRWTGQDLSGQLRGIEVAFVRQDGSRRHDISSRFDDLFGQLFASDMENDTVNWWWLYVKLHVVNERGQTLVCQQRVPAIDPVMAALAKELMTTNPEMSFETALLQAYLKLSTPSTLTP